MFFLALRSGDGSTPRAGGGEREREREVQREKKETERERRREKREERSGKIGRAHRGLQRERERVEGPAHATVGC